MATIGTLPGERLAGLSADLFHKLQKGVRTLDELALFNQGKNPFTFERNQHGHIVLTITGLDLSGATEIERLEASGYRISDCDKLCLHSKMADSYDRNHRLLEGQIYQIALMPGKEIVRHAERTTENLRKRGMEHYGYGEPLAGSIPRVRESVSDKKMEEMGAWHIVALHDHILAPAGNPRVLGAYRNHRGSWLGAYWDGPGNKWDDACLFAFPVPAS